MTDINRESCEEKVAIAAPPQMAGVTKSGIKAKLLSYEPRLIFVPGTGFERKYLLQSDDIRVDATEHCDYAFRPNPAV